MKLPWAKKPKIHGEMLDFIKAHIKEYSSPPTRRELAAVMGVSKQAIDQRLKFMHKHKVIELIPGRSRGIKVLEKKDD